MVSTVRSLPTHSGGSTPTMTDQTPHINGRWLWDAKAVRPVRAPEAGVLSEERLAAYIDGRLAAPERAVVEQAIAADPEAYAWLVDAIAVARGLPEDDEVDARAPMAAPATPEPRRWWPLAAAGLATAATLFLLVRDDEPGRDSPSPSPAAIAEDVAAPERTAALARAVESPRAASAGVRGVETERPRSPDVQLQAVRMATSRALAASLLSRKRPWDAWAVIERARAKRYGIELGQVDTPVPAAHLQLSIAEVGGRYAVFARWPSGRLAFDLSLDSEQLRAAVSAIAGGARRGLARSEAATALGAELFTPVRAQLTRASTVIVCADGVLSAVPWALLPDPDGGLLVERYTLMAAPWCAGAPDMAQAVGGGTGPTLVAGVPDRISATEPTPAVPVAAEEVVAVGRELAGADVLIGDQLTRDALRLRLPGLGLLHFAGDAVAHPDDPRLSRLLVSPSPADPQGAFFAGDILGLHLPRSVVVLSAGESPLGVTSAGDGISDLADAFLVAGASSVVTTSWRTSDRHAARFFVELHRRRASGERVSDAVRETQLWARHEQMSPAVWASVTARVLLQAPPLRR